MKRAEVSPAACHCCCWGSSQYLKRNMDCNSNQCPTQGLWGDFFYQYVYFDLYPQPKYLQDVFFLSPLLFIWIIFLQKLQRELTQQVINTLYSPSEERGFARCISHSQNATPCPTERPCLVKDALLFFCPSVSLLVSQTPQYGSLFHFHLYSWRNPLQGHQVTCPTAIFQIGTDFILLNAFF